MHYPHWLAEISMVSMATGKRVSPMFVSHVYKGAGAFGTVFAAQMVKAVSMGI